MAFLVEALRWSAIVAGCVSAAAAYGIVHDQITARICVEYFTIGHPPVWFGTKDPTTLGLVWGVVATWWVGAILGVGLAVAARGGRPPRTPLRELVRPVGALLAAMAVGAAVAGALGGVLGSIGAARLVGSIAERVPADRHVPFLIDLWAHSASYALGFLGGAAVILRVRRDRKRARARLDDAPSGPTLPMS